MKTPKVRLYIRIRRKDGEDAFADPVWGRNRALRQGWAVAGGEQEAHSEGVYYLRYARGGKRVWQSVGVAAELALVAMHNLEHDLQAQALGRTPTSGPATEAPSKQETVRAIVVSDAVRLCLEEVALHRAPKTLAASTHMLNLFAERFGTRKISEIERTQLLDHITFLRKRGLSERTVFNHIARITSLLKQNGNSGVLRACDWPRYDEKVVSAYHREQLASLFAACGEKERLLFEFFLSTGCREQEVMHATWQDVNFRDKVFLVKAKPEYGFRPKDKEERAIPIPDSLVDALAEHRKRSTSHLVFPGASGRPEGHFLRKLQRLAFCAGLNCGTCITKGGRPCTHNATCRRWGLHEFRRTFATSHAEAGVPVPTIQRWLGHSDLTTTMRYLAVADLRSDRTRSQVNASFSFLSERRAA